MTCQMCASCLRTASSSRHASSLARMTPLIGKPDSEVRWGSSAPDVNGRATPVWSVSRDRHRGVLIDHQKAVDRAVTAEHHVAVSVGGGERPRTSLARTPVAADSYQEPRVLPFPGRAERSWRCAHRSRCRRREVRRESVGTEELFSPELGAEVFNPAGQRKKFSFLGGILICRRAFTAGAASASAGLRDVARIAKSFKRKNCFAML